MALKLKLKAFFDKEAKTLIRSYKRLISVRRGVSNDNAPSNMPSTRRGKGGRDHWLLNTGELKQQGFEFKTTNNRMMVFAAGKRHSPPRVGKRRTGSKAPSQPTYRQLFRWHGRGRKGNTYSGIFGRLPYNSRFPERFTNECIEQLNPQITKAFTKKYKVNIL